MYLMIFFIFSLIMLIYGIIKYQKATKIEIQKYTEQEQLEKEYQQIEEQIQLLSNSKAQLEEAVNNEKQKFEELYNKEKNKLSEQTKLLKENADNARDNYFAALEQSYQAKEKEYDTEMRQLENDKETAVAALKKIQNSLSAATEAHLREREKEENLKFYKVSLTPLEEEDIMRLEEVKTFLHQPVILSKLIWSTYFQKQTTDMCNRVLGTKTVCGIYKITNIKTNQCYIGQSVDVSERFKQHMKCGLGIDASATNKLYNAMQKDKVWNFTFELIEECPREQLNEKERQWIQMYQSDKMGYNITKGNK